MKKTYDCIFLDRDGTINPDSGYISKLDDFKFFEFTPLKKNQFVLTNFESTLSSSIERGKKSVIKSSKPKMVVREVKHPFDPVKKMVDTLHNQGVGVTTIYESKKQMIPMLKNYATKTGYKRGAKNFIKEVIHKLSKK